jgi:hypothetical protein
VEGRDHMDLIAEFAYPLPITVISRSETVKKGKC